MKGPKYFKPVSNKMNIKKFFIWCVRFPIYVSELLLYVMFNVALEIWFYLFGRLKSVISAEKVESEAKEKELPLTETNGHFAGLPSGKCFYIEDGEESNPVVILIHGYTNISSVYEPIIPYIVYKYYIYCYKKKYRLNLDIMYMQ